MTETLGDRAERALRVVEEAPIIAYDTETSGLDWKRNNPVGYVITTEDFNAYIPVRHGGGGNLVDAQCGPLTSPDAPTVQHSFEKALSKAFKVRRQRGLLTVGHNLKFDMHFSANQDIYLGRNCGDTQNNAALLDEYARSYSLENCALREGVTAKKAQEMYDHLTQLFNLTEAKKGQMEHFWRTSGTDPIVQDYAMGDGTTTLELWGAQQKQIDDEELRVVADMENELIWTIFRMERRGIKVDEQYIEELMKAVDAELLQARSMLPRNFNERSAPQVRKLCEDLGVTNWPTTELGNASFPEKFLETFPTGKAIIEVRKLSNLGNTFVTPLREQHIWQGRVHAQLHQLKSDEFGTISGRFSCSDPNLQAIHKRNKVLGRRFRRIFVADDGFDFYEDDYSQCEPRLFAHYSKDEVLTNGYNSNPPRDMHHAVAEMLDVERDPTAKRMNMGILTGMQVKTFAGHMDWPLDLAQEKFNAWFDAFPGIRKFQGTAKQVMIQRGFVKTLLGRRGRLDQARFAYKAVSKLIQGGNGDIIKWKLLMADKLFESLGDIAHLLMTVHDSVNSQIPKGAEGEKLHREMIDMFVDVQSPPFNLRVPFVMDSGKGDNWADATYGPEKITAPA